MSPDHGINVDRARKNVHPSVFVADTATIIGDVVIGENSSVWFSAVVRGDAARIVIGRGSSIQDGAIVHADADGAARIGDNVTMGHAAIVHGAVVDDNVIIGIGARILNGAHIGECSIVAAGALVPERMEVPPRSLVMGMPARVVRQITDADVGRIRRSAENYQKNRAAYKAADDE